MIEITPSTELPSVRESVELKTQDNLKLIGELALPVAGEAAGVLLTLHPLPTHGGFMDSHILRKAANRLPQLANLAVLRFNTRGTRSPHGVSEGYFSDGIEERFDLEAALDFLLARGFQNIWLVGWSFGTELALKYGHDKQITGAILLSPPLHRANDKDLSKWIGNPRRLIALVPEHDDYLPPKDAAERFAIVPNAHVLGIDGAKHLWVGEKATKTVLNEIVRFVNPERYPLPEYF